MKTEQQARKEFAAYFLDLKASMEKEGGKVEKFAEWERFIEHQIEEGDYPTDAVSWKCPRSLKAVWANDKKENPITEATSPSSKKQV